MFLNHQESAQYIEDFFTKVFKDVAGAFHDREQIIEKRNESDPFPIENEVLFFMEEPPGYEFDLLRWLNLINSLDISRSRSERDVSHGFLHQGLHFFSGYSVVGVYIHKYSPTVAMINVETRSLEDFAKKMIERSVGHISKFFSDHEYASINGTIRSLEGNQESFIKESIDAFIEHVEERLANGKYPEESPIDLIDSLTVTRLTTIKDYPEGHILHRFNVV